MDDKDTRQGVDILEHNREAWTRQVTIGDKWTIPVDPGVIAKAREGLVDLLLTPTRFVPADWYPGFEDNDVLCLASAGGQQGPVIAAAGARVVVLDACPAQLDQDRRVAERDRLTIRAEEGDMRDLSRFPDGSFDWIFHPVSNCFVDEIRSVWRECHRVLRPGGVLLSGITNPVTYIFDFKEWDDNGRLVVRYKIPYSDIDQLPEEEMAKRLEKKETLEFGHTLSDQIGGQIAAGFRITGFFEDNAGGDLLDPHIDTFIATRAEKP